MISLTGWGHGDILGTLNGSGDGFTDSSHSDMHGKVSPSHPNHKLLVIEVKFYENKTPLKDKSKEEREMLKLSMIDAKGRIYSSPLTKSNNVIFRYILYGENPKEAYEKEGFIYQVFFSLPKKSSGFRLQFRDLPQVSLGL